MNKGHVVLIRLQISQIAQIRERLIHNKNNIGLCPVCRRRIIVLTGQNIRGYITVRIYSIILQCTVHIIRHQGSIVSGRFSYHQILCIQAEIEKEPVL